MSDTNNLRKIAGSSVASLIATSGATAAIVTNTNLGLSGFTVVDASGSVDWNVDNQGSNEAFITVFNSGNNVQLGFGTFFVTEGPGAGPIVKVNSGSSVNSTDYFGIGTATVVRNAQMDTAVRLGASFDSGVPSFVGFTFDYDTGGSNFISAYGWAKIIITAQLNSSSFEVVSWAYEDTGAPIQAGAVPEPETAAVGLAGLALGVAGLRRWRNGRQAT